MANLTRFRPVSPMASLRRELDRMFEDTFSDSDEDGERSAALWSPRMDLTESDDAYVASLDLPGLNRDDITVNFENGTLTIAGEREARRSEENENYHSMERSFGRFYRSFRVPREVKEDEVEASFDKGVLSIRIPKAEQVRPRKIDIQ